MLKSIKHATRDVNYPTDISNLGTPFDGAKGDQIWVPISIVICLFGAVQQQTLYIERLNKKAGPKGKSIVEFGIEQ